MSKALTRVMARNCKAFSSFERSQTRGSDRDSGREDLDAPLVAVGAALEADALVQPVLDALPELERVGLHAVAAPITGRPETQTALSRIRRLIVSNTRIDAPVVGARHRLSLVLLLEGRKAGAQRLRRRTVITDRKSESPEADETTKQCAPRGRGSRATGARRRWRPPATRAADSRRTRSILRHWCGSRVPQPAPAGSNIPSRTAAPRDC